MTKYLPFLAACVLTLGSAARAEGWKLSLGANYRTYRDLHAEAVDFNGSAYGSSFNGKTYVDGAVVSNGLGGATYTVRSATNQISQPALDTATFRGVAFEGGNDETDPGLGMIIRASRELVTRNGVDIRLDLSLTTAHSSTDSTFAAGATLDSFDVTVPGWPAAGPGIPAPGPLVSANAPVQIAAVPVAAAGATVDYDFDLDIYAIGAGLALEYRLGRLSLSLAGGGAVHVADHDSTRIERVDWNSGGTVYRNRTRNSGIKILPGAYLTAGLELALDERVSLGVEARYDEVFRDLDMGLARVDLSGFSGQILLAVRF